MGLEPTAPPSPPNPTPDERNARLGAFLLDPATLRDRVAALEIDGGSRPRAEGRG